MARRLSREAITRRFGAGPGVAGDGLSGYPGGHGVGGVSVADEGEEQPANCRDEEGGDLGGAPREVALEGGEVLG